MALLERCRERNLKLNPQKLKFKLRNIAFMGHQISEDGLVLDDSKMCAITKMPIPQDKKSVQRFLGMCNYLAPYISNLSELCAPLREISNPSSEFSWSSKQQAAFEKIQERISSASTLQYFDPKKPIPLQVDTSSYGLGASLIQEGKPVAYSSSTMSESEQNNYAQIENECLAIVHAMTRWDQWLYGHQNILVETDHKPLETIFKHPITHAPKRLHKIMLKLQRYSFAIQHKKGSAMLLADTLSRAPVSSVFKPDHNFEVFSADTLNTDNKPDRITDRTLELIKRATRDDPVLSHLIPYIQHGWPDHKSEVPPELCLFWNYRWEFVYVDGVIYYSKDNAC